MSTVSIAAYFPFRRVRICRQSVAAEADLAVIDVVPDRRFRPICYRCASTRRIQQRDIRSIRDLNFAPAQGATRRCARAELTLEPMRNILIYCGK